MLFYIVNLPTFSFSLSFSFALSLSLSLSHLLLGSHLDQFALINDTKHVKEKYEDKAVAYSSAPDGGPWRLSRMRNMLVFTATDVY